MPRLRLICLIALVVGAFVSAVLLLPHSPTELRALILGAGVVAPAIALGAWTLLTPAMFSGALLAGACGLAFGAVGGAALSVGGAVLGGLAAFALARTVARPQVEATLLQRPTFQRIHALLERRGFLAVLAARLMPGIPATGLHYAAGVSPVGARAFAGAMAVGALLRTTPYALLGQGLGSGSLATIVVAAVSIGFSGIAAALLIRRLARHPRDGRTHAPECAGRRTNWALTRPSEALWSVRIWRSRWGSYGESSSGGQARV